MFAPEGWISAPDVIQRLFVTNLSDPKYRKLSKREQQEKAFEDFRVFVGSVPIGGALHPNGQLFRIGPAFLYQFTPSGRDHYLFSLWSGQVRNLSEARIRVEGGKSKQRKIRGIRDFFFSLLPFVHYSAALCLSMFLVALAALSLFQNISHPHFFEMPLIGTALYLSVIFGFPAGFALYVFRIMYSNPVLRGSKPILDVGDFKGCSVVFREEDIYSFESDIENLNVSEPNGVSEEIASKTIVEAFDRGETFTRAEMKALFGNDLTSRGFERAWSRARESRPELGKPGRKRLN